MCIGVPMRILATYPGRALCEGQGGESRMIDMALVGDQPLGSWVLVFLEAAREVVTADEAALVGDALAALGLAMQGEANLDHLFPDLAGRDPELPPHLKAASLNRAS